MSKKQNLKALEQKVIRTENDLIKLYEQKEKLEAEYQQKLDKLNDKINQQKTKVTEAESERNLCLLFESGKDYQQLKAMMLGQEKVGDGHV